MITLALCEMDIASGGIGRKARLNAMYRRMQLLVYKMSIMRRSLVGAA